MGGFETVLVVDDSAIAAKQVGHAVASATGWQVVGHARNGAEALKLYEELSPDVVCMDLIMPVLDGLEATRSILKLDPNATVIVVSSVGGNEDRILEALGAGAAAVITKPFAVEQIRTMLREL